MADLLVQNTLTMADLLVQTTTTISMAAKHPEVPGATGS
jgi:hypothetical protein